MSTSSTSSSSLFSPLQFTGVSQFSSDFQSILTHAQAVAQIPVQALQNQESTIQGEEAALSSLGTSAVAVTNALQALGNLGSGGALAASTTDSSVVSAQATGATTPVSYSITQVTSLASAASERSNTSYTDATSAPVSTTGSMQLVIGSSKYNITLGTGENNLNGVVAAINNLNAGVTASVITAGTNTDYLSVSANSTGATTLQLIDDPKGAATNILTDTNQGSNTNFYLNGISVSSPTTTVNNVIPGVTLTFNGTTSGSESIGVNVATSPDQISTALQNLATAYNNLLAANQAQIGSGAGTAGALSGNNIVYQLNSAMNALVQYQGGSNGITNLANLGLEIGTNGQMTFDQNTFDSLNTSQINSALSFLGSATSGFAGLQQQFAAITDPISGAITVQQQQWNQQTQNINSQITTLQQKITLMEQSLNQQVQATDASIASLESQQSVLTSSITALDYTSFGYNTSVTSPAY